MKDETVNYVAEEILLTRINYLKGILNEMPYENSENNAELINISHQLDQLIVEYMRLNNDAT
jgi:hypothetical protein